MKSVERKPQGAEIREPDPLLTPEQRERQRQAAALVREWAKEEEDDGLWPLVEEELSLSNSPSSPRGTERETVLDAIAFRQELLDGIQVLSGLQIDPIR